MISKNPFKIVFMGTPGFAATNLSVLIKNDIIPELVYTQPARRKGRGLQKEDPPVALLAREYGIPVLQPEKASSEESVKVLQGIKPDLIVVVAYGELLKKKRSRSAKVWMHKFACIPASFLQRCCTDYLGNSKWRKGYRGYNLPVR